jgi:II/X family phage/plasmid replication protein
MLDLLRLMIPFRPEYCVQLECRSSNGSAYYEELNVAKVSADTGFIGAGAIERDEFGNVNNVFSEFIPYQQIPSSYTGIALKFHNGSQSMPPHIELKASPAKIIQGHNVFGSNCLLLAYSEFYSSLVMSNPELAFMVDWDRAQVLQLDCTFSASVETEQQCKQVINHFRNVSHGQVRSSRYDFETTCKHNTNSSYWGGKTYSKYHEYVKQYQEYSDKAKKGDRHAQFVFDAMSDPRILHFSKYLVRFESEVKKRKLAKLDLPTNIHDLIKYQQQLKEQTGKELIEELWKETYGKLIDNTFKGQTMNIYDDEKVQQTLRAFHQKLTPKGNISYAKADRAFSFYRRMVNEGFKEVQRSFTVRKSFYNNLNMLLDAGFTKAQLQNLAGNGMNKVVPLCEVITIDFSSQVPDWYIEPEYGPMTKQLMGLDDNVIQLKTA